jgi:predicted MPP superfamily phosphohydrolase
MQMPIFIFSLCLIVFDLHASLQHRRVVVISDFNGSYGSVKYGPQVHSAIKKVTELNPDIVISTGDMVAGQKSGLDYQSMWDAFNQAVTIPLLNKSIPFAITVGNHDGSGYSQYSLEREFFVKQWNRYKADLNYLDDSNYPLYYSFEVNEMLFISIDTTLVGNLSKSQLIFLQQQLSLYNNKKHKFIFTHVPMFQFNQDSINESYFDNNILSLIKQYNVQFYLTGHQHTYYPGFFDGTHHISQACLGAGARKLIGSDVVSARAITVIDLYDTHSEVFALYGDQFEKRVDHATLPQSLTSKNKTLWLKDYVAH